MSVLHRHVPVKLMAALLYADPAQSEFAEARLVERWGPVENRLPPYAFTFTGYYAVEMGPTLQKTIISFARLVAPECLPDIKHTCVALEATLAINDHRRVNIDPGYLTAAKLVLSTGKDFSHRVYLGAGVFGDVHLEVSGGRFVARPWTYPDYRQDSVLQFLDAVRRQYTAQLTGGDDHVA